MDASENYKSGPAPPTGRRGQPPGRLQVARVHEYGKERREALILILHENAKDYESMFHMVKTSSKNQRCTILL